MAEIAFLYVYKGWEVEVKWHQLVLSPTIGVLVLYPCLMMNNLGAQNGAGGRPQPQPRAQSSSYAQIRCNE